MIEIHHARPPERDSAEELWRFAFGDGPELQREFYRLCAPEGPLVLLEDGELRSALALPRVSLILADGRRLRAGYVYALATRPGFGGQGWASTLLQCAAGLARDWGLDCLITVPEPSSLFAFYEKNGFRPGFYLRNITAQPVPAPAVPVSPAEYNTLREQLLSSRAHVSCTEGQIAFQQYLCGLSGRPGGGLYRLGLAHGPGCAAVESLERPVVKELLCAPEDVERGAAACAALCGAPVTARFPSDAADGTPFGAIRWLEGTPASIRSKAGEGWLGLAFD